MAAILGRTELQIKKTGTATTVPNDPIARLMYYFNCICTCVEADDDYSIRRLGDYKNYLNLSSQEEAQLLILCAALSPEKLEGTIFFKAESAFDGFGNEFFELSQVNTGVIVTKSLFIGEQEKRIRKVMMFTQSWIQNNYHNPLRAAFERRERRLPAPPPPYYTRSPPVPVMTPPSQPYTRPVTHQPYTRPVTTGGQYTHKVQQPYSNDAGAGGLIFGICTTFCLAIFGCWWALPCSITAIVLGITVAGESHSAKILAAKFTNSQLYSQFQEWIVTFCMPPFVVATLVFLSLIATMATTPLPAPRKLVLCSVQSAAG